MPLKKNDEISLEIESISSEGSGVGRFNGQTVFVNAAAAGDIVKVHIIKAKQKYAVGIISEIIRPSADRTECDCPVFSKCGGCAYRHIKYESELKWKYKTVADALKRIGGIDIVPDEIIGAENADRYRNKAQYPVGLSAKNELLIGFYSPKSHRIVNCENCLLQPEEFNEILKCIRCWILTSGVTVYNEETGRGQLRHIYLRRAEATGEIMVCLVINGESVPKATDLLKELLKTDENIKTVILNINRENTNVVLGKNSINLYGDGYITDVLCEKRIRISPLSFYQVNREQAQKLYRKAAEFAGLTGNETLLDLYCGAGTIGLSMSDKVKKLIGVEIIPEAVEDAKFNAKLNSAENAEFICGDAKIAAKHFLENGTNPDVIIIDPPRKGCAPEVIEAIADMNPDRVVYVSCDPATLARDCARFRELGYACRRVQPVDMFPHTGHVETVVLMSKEK